MASVFRCGGALKAFVLAIAGYLMLSSTVGWCDPVIDSTACVDALEQISVLKTTAPVYKLGKEEDHFIDDADRPAELSRLQRIVDAKCSKDSDERKRQEAAAYRLHVARSPECTVDWQTLITMEDPHSRDSKDAIERQRKIVAENCPDVSYKDRWIVFYLGTLEKPPDETDIR